MQSISSIQVQINSPILNHVSGQKRSSSGKFKIQDHFFQVSSDTNWEPFVPFFCTPKFYTWSHLGSKSREFSVFVAFHTSIAIHSHWWTVFFVCGFPSTSSHCWRSCYVTRCCWVAVPDLPYRSASRLPEHLESGTDAPQAAEASEDVKKKQKKQWRKVI